MSINNSTLKFYFPHSMSLFNLLQYNIINIELLKEGDDEKYNNLLTTMIVCADTNKNFPKITTEQVLDQLTKEKQNCRAFDIVSALKRIYLIQEV